VEFEKWQALGNDYVIVEASKLPFDLTPKRVEALCAPRTGLCADGVLLLSEPDAPVSAPGERESQPDEPRCLARLRIFNPDGSEAEVSGNGAREAALYLRRRGWAEGDAFSIQTAAGELRVRIASATTCTIEMGGARLRSADFPSGGDDGVGELVAGGPGEPGRRTMANWLSYGRPIRHRSSSHAGGRTWRFRHVQVGNPQVSIQVADENELYALDLGSLGPEIERHELFPNRTNVSWFAVLGPRRIRVRVFERGAGETSASGTGASGAAVAYVLAGGESPVTTVLDGGELEVEVGEELQIKLTGWAVPVYRGALAEDFTQELDAIE
jgi:diaminopimelate epimerase